ncbi:uncharacterized protein ARMOST_15256 [Armillaria ostoyae]|uniref:Uncharacterized protein n=1 Tax=Armillaria ostoyae TaxID=47428 RepID=A0A284RT33_ARMOS|nr:uncharacterized protein ARMOST_15256 [Armillaria ostoyae]
MPCYAYFFNSSLTQRSPALSCLCEVDSRALFPPVTSKQYWNHFPPPSLAVDCVTNIGSLLPLSFQFYPVTGHLLFKMKVGIYITEEVSESFDLYVEDETRDVRTALEGSIDLIQEASQGECPVNCVMIDLVSDGAALNRAAVFGRLGNQLGMFVYTQNIQSADDITFISQYWMDGFTFRIPRGVLVDGEPRFRIRHTETRYVFLVVS